MKNIKLLTPVLLACALAACGGGEDQAGADAGAPAAAPASAPASSGSVSAQFVHGSAARVMLLGVGSQTVGALSSSKQESNGAMSALGDVTLSGSTVVRDIAGDAHFAQGRWAGGTLTKPSGQTTLANNNVYHYLAYNSLQVHPASGSLSCEAGVLTAPTYIGGGPGGPEDAGVAEGTASLAFDATGGVVKGNISGTVKGKKTVTTIDTVVSGGGSTSGVGGFLSGGAGALVTLGDAGPNAYKVLVAYALTFADGARYQGLATFSCK